MRGVRCFSADKNLRCSEETALSQAGGVACSLSLGSAALAVQVQIPSPPPKIKGAAKGMLTVIRVPKFTLAHCMHFQLPSRPSTGPFEKAGFGPERLDSAIGVSAQPHGCCGPTK
eukprot:6210225-Pleurochrysis_carterae.AAC.7